MAENNREQIIGGNPKPFFIPEATKPSRIEPLEPVKRPTLPDFRSNDPIIDFTSIRNESEPQVASGNESGEGKRFSDILNALEDCVEDPERKSELQKIAADYVDHPEDFKGAVGLLASISDLTEREYLAGLMARYTALEASRQPGGAVENDIAFRKFDNFKRIAFPKPEEILQGV